MGDLSEWQWKVIGVIHYASSVPPLFHSISFHSFPFSSIFHGTEITMEIIQYLLYRFLFHPLCHGFTHHAETETFSIILFSDKNAMGSVLFKPHSLDRVELHVDARSTCVLAKGTVKVKGNRISHIQDLENQPYTRGSAS